MIKFNLPQNLDGAILRAELRAAGIDIEDGSGHVLIENDELFLNIKAKDKTAAEAVVAAHNSIS
jgi:hypothetical protein